MKKILFMLAVLTGMFILTGCGESPKEAAIKFCKAVEAGDIETVKKYSAKPIGTKEEKMIGSAEFKAEIKEVRTKLENDFEKEEIDGDTAKIYVKGEKSPMRMKKVDGKWKVEG